MKIIHIIFNAHIDPIWLWPWQAGVDEALATCRSMCDRLDRHPDIVFTRGEAWIYSQIERLDEKLFARVAAHVKAKRWEIVGGWWIQPDCNAPSGFAMEKQIALGREYFLDRFGFFPRIAYNVDSFGHAATLPGYMRAAGQDRYVMMRPQEHEKALPARIFRWRGYDDGPQVTVFRIAGGYCNTAIEPAIEKSLTELPAGINHTMCFMGVGDHGGGPTEEMIQSIREQQKTRKDVKIIFSSPARFFDAIENKTDALPLVVGELQHHAIGCYSVHRPIKTDVRRCEHLLKQAETASQGSNSESLATAWRAVAFHQFHDTLGGTCIPSAYRAAHDQLSSAAAAADEILQFSLRKRTGALPPDPLQRMVFLNASDHPFDGYVEAEPWMGWRQWNDSYRLVDEDGKIVQHQLMQSESLIWGPPRLLLRLKLAAGRMAIIRIGNLRRKTRWRPVGGDDWPKTLPGFGPIAPRLDLLTDLTDTWSHGIARYDEGPIISPVYHAPALTDRGPLMAAWVRNGTLADSTIREEWRVYQGSPYVELKLTVNWRQQHQILKMTLPLNIEEARRTDGIMGGYLSRENDGCERPLRDLVLIKQGKAGLGIVCPDVFAVDATPRRIRFTLLRSPLMCWHDPFRAHVPRASFSDQGVHEFRFRFFAGKNLSPQMLDRQALMMQRPLIYADLTVGMAARS